MKVIIVQDSLAIPIGNIDYVQLKDDICEVEICTKTMGHRVSFDTVDEAIELFDTVVEMIDKFYR